MDDPRSEPRALHELTQKKMAEDVLYQYSPNWKAFAMQILVLYLITY